VRVGAGRLAGLPGGSGGGELVRGSGIPRRRAWRGASGHQAEQTNRNAGFIRQAGEWDWGSWMNPAFRWWCQDAPDGGGVPNLCLTWHGGLL
jgi:hypothetical protein